MTYEKELLKQRLLSKIKVNSDTQCWEWTDCCDHVGYGLIRIRSWPYSLGAHRVSAYVFLGVSIYKREDNKYICHHCDNPPCINPSHLFVGTAKENMHDAIRKGKMNFDRSSCGGMRKEWIGTKCKQAKLNKKSVLEIRRRYNSGDSGTHLAKEFGLSNGAMYRVINRQSWRHV